MNSEYLRSFGRDELNALLDLLGRVDGGFEENRERNPSPYE